MDTVDLRKMYPLEKTTTVGIMEPYLPEVPVPFPAMLAVLWRLVVISDPLFGALLQLQ